MEKEKVMYVLIKKKLSEHADAKGELERSEANKCMGMYRIPRLFWKDIMNELVKLGIIEEVDKFKVKVK